MSFILIYLCKVSWTINLNKKINYIISNVISNFKLELILTHQRVSYLIGLN